MNGYDFFKLTNLLNPTRDESEQVGDLQGSYSLGTYSGMGAGYSHALSEYTGEFSSSIGTAGMIFSHNSANAASIATPDGAINSFYLSVGTHANESSTQGTFNVTITNSTGQTQTINNIAYGWIGFVFDEGSYLTDIKITQNANPNTGFFFDFVPGDGALLNGGGDDVGVASTPEPATMLIVGLGLAGAGWASRRRWKK